MPTLEDSHVCIYMYTVVLILFLLFPLSRTSKIGGGARQLTDRQRKSLYNSQLQEFKRRYGRKLGADRRAEMLLCESAQRDLVGVAAVEVEKIPASSLASASTGARPS